MKPFIQYFFLIILLSFIVSVIKAEISSLDSYHQSLDKAHNNWVQNRDNSLYKQLLEEYPQKQYETSTFLSFSYYLLEEYDELFKLFEWAFRKGFVYDSDFLADMKKIQDLDEFKEILKLNEDLKEKAKRKSKPFLDVITPEKYIEQNKYPIFIVLNKGIRDRETLIFKYRSDIIKSGYILAFMRSSQFLSTNSYSWGNIDLSREEIYQMFNQVTESYSIDTTKVIISGMSSAGAMALDIIMNDIIPVKGFIVFCPTKPKSLFEDNIIKAKNRNVKGSIIAGEQDKRWLPKAKEMNKIFKELDFSCCFKINNHGHIISDDSHKQIDESIDYIFEAQ